jgi:hypothetical protein
MLSGLYRHTMQTSVAIERQLHVVMLILFGSRTGQAMAPERHLARGFKILVTGHQPGTNRYIVLTVGTCKLDNSVDQNFLQSLWTNST